MEELARVTVERESRYRPDQQPAKAAAVAAIAAAIAAAVAGHRRA